MGSRNLRLQTLDRLRPADGFSSPASRRNRRHVASDRRRAAAIGARSGRTHRDPGVPAGSQGDRSCAQSSCCRPRPERPPGACASGSSRPPVRSGSGRWSSAARRHRQPPAGSCRRAPPTPGPVSVRYDLWLEGADERLAASSHRRRQGGGRPARAGAPGGGPCVADVGRVARFRKTSRVGHLVIRWGDYQATGRRAVHQSCTAGASRRTARRTKRSTARTTRTPACCPARGCSPRGTKPPWCCRKGRA